MDNEKSDMSTEIGIRQTGGILILSPRGRLVFGTGDVLRQTLLTQFDQGHHRILVDLSQVDFLDSMSIGDLVGAYASITRRGGAMALLNPTKPVRESLRITHMDQLFPIHTSEAAAAAGLNSSSSGSRATLDDFLDS